MSLFQWMGMAWWGSRRIEDLAEQLAAVSLGEVQSRLSYQAGGMSTYELRGYVRARAVPVAERVAYEAGVRHQLAAQACSLLYHRLLDVLTRRVHHDFSARLLIQRARRAA